LIIQDGYTSQQMNTEFWDYLDRLVAEGHIIVERPRGSVHPRYPELIYPLDYGYLEGIFGGDGAELDVWIGSLSLEKPDALAMTVDLHKRDAEIKLLLGCTEVEKQVIMDFLNGESMRASLVRRDDELALLRERSSVRRFREQPVDEVVLRRILTAATWAPSAHNRQPWRFVALTKPDVKARLAKSMAEDFRRDLLADGLSPEQVEAQTARSQARVLDAPVAVLLCLDVSVGDQYPDARRQQAEYLMGTQGVALAGGHLLLAAHALGLGAVWTCAPLFAPIAVRQALALPEDWSPQALILLGYPAKPPTRRERRLLDEVAIFL
jgi:coenzyme F420-0:L-glutamate ligase/coenzyme F420-1:gamma-L-glutamate ligase